LTKTALEKLIDAIAKAAALKDASVIGDQEGQFAQESVDTLSSAIERAQEVVDADNLQAAETEIKTLNAAVKEFEASLINSLESDSPKVSLKGVVLKGTDSEKKGVHTLFAYGGTVVFHDGEANVSDELAGKLIADGYAAEGKTEAGE
jgi:hypothetical protein